MARSSTTVIAQARSNPSAAAVCVCLILFILALSLARCRSHDHHHDPYPPFPDGHDPRSEKSGRSEHDRGGNGGDNERSRDRDRDQDRDRDRGRDRGSREKDESSRPEREHRKPSETEDPKKSTSTKTDGKADPTPPPAETAPDNDSTEVPPTAGKPIARRKSVTGGKPGPGIIKGWKDGHPVDPPPPTPTGAKKKTHWNEKNVDTLQAPADITGVAQAVEHPDGGVRLNDQTDIPYQWKVPGKPDKAIPYSQTPARRIRVDPSKVNAESLRSILEKDHGPALTIIAQAEELVKEYNKVHDSPEYVRSDRYKSLLADVWHPKLGPVPTIMLKCAQAIGKVLTEKDVQTVMQIMMEREKLKAKGFLIDDKRSLDSFYRRSYLNPKEPPDGTDFALAWFIDHYRFSAWEEVMAICCEPIDMLKYVGEKIYLFQWLEWMGQQFFIIRAFSHWGADLVGLGLRVKVEPYVAKPSLWTLDLTCFMWSSSDEKEQIARALSLTGED